jgi:hypothetical protein
MSIAASAIQTRIDALQNNGTFSFPTLSRPQQQQQSDLRQQSTLGQPIQKKRERDDSAASAVDWESKYKRSKVQYATLDRTLREHVEQSEKNEIALVKMTQLRDAILSENERLKEKVAELYQTITQLSKAAAQDREKAVIEALASSSSSRARQ